MTRSIVWFCLAGILLFTAGCAESLHQGQRHAGWSHRSNTGYADGSAYGGAGYWWYPFG